jgi:hypothetical protein
MSFASGARELRKCALTMLETHIVMSSLIFLPRSYSRGLPRIYCRALPQFSHGSNHRSYGFGSRENHFVPTRFGYGPRPHRGDHSPRRPGFPA